MNKKILTVAILSICLCFVFVATGATDIPFNPVKHTSIEKIRFPSPADSTAGQIFELNTKNMVNKDVPQVAKAIEIKNKKSYDDSDLLAAFNITDYSKNDKSGYLIYENNKAELRIYDSGQFLYYSKMNNILTLNEKINLSDEECIKKAREFLEKNQLLNMDVFNISVNDITKTNAANLDDEDTIGKDVYFSRSINGSEVYGISRIIVTIAPNGEISEVRSLYRDTGNSIEAKVKSIEEAIESVENHDAMIEIEPGVERVDLEKLEIVYWEDSSPKSETQYIQPVYRFIGKGYTSDGEESNFIAITSMIDEESTIADERERQSRNTEKVIESSE